MKLHELRPAPGSKTARIRVGRGIAAGKGKTAGRGTKGQKARAGGSIPPWFEGGQTPLHQRIPKLRGFKNRFKVEYEVVNVGAIGQRVEAGAFAAAGHGTGAGNGSKTAAASKKAEQLTINADVLRAVGLVRDVKKPLKVLGGGDLSASLFVVADAFTKSAIEKIEAAGGVVSVLEVPTETRLALGLGEDSVRTPRVPRTAAGRASADRRSDARATREADAADAASEAEATTAAKAASAPKGPKPPKATIKKSAETASATDEEAGEGATATPADVEAIVDAPDSADAVEGSSSSSRAGSTDDPSDRSTDESSRPAAEEAPEAETDQATPGDESA
jgi:large subunit ribosomal protein L15